MRNRVSRLRAAAGIVVAAMLGSSVVAASAASSSGSAESATPQASFVPGRVLVKYKHNVTPAVQEALEHASGASRVSTIRDLGVDVLRVPAGNEQRVVSALSRSGKVAYAERDALATVTDVTPDDPYWAKQWGESLIGAPSAWSVTTGSSSVVVAVLDSGLNASLPEFAGRVVAGYNFIANTTDTADDNSHGTAATGVAAAAGNNATNAAGLCWQCDIMPVKVIDANGNAPYSAVSSGITWAVDHGAKVLNLSLGGTSASSTLQNAVAYAVTHDAVVVAGAGNNSSSAPFYPAYYDGVISVAGTDQYDHLYSWSDYGAWVDVAAPGNNYSTWPSGSVNLFGGTSSASPVVAGLAGLILSASPSMAAADVASTIEGTADPLPAGTVNYGRVDAARALATISGNGTTPTASPSATASPTPLATASPTATTSNSPAPSPSPTVSSTTSSSPSPSATATPAPTPTTTTTTVSGSLPASGSKSWSFTTTGGPVTVTVTGAGGAITVSIVDGTGAQIATSTGGKGTTITGSVAPGNFTVTASGSKTKVQLSVTYSS